MLDLQRDVVGFTCETNAEFRAVAGAQCRMRTLLDGNQLGGFFTLTYDGQTTSSIAHDASATDMQTALTALDKIQSLVSWVLLFLSRDCCLSRTTVCQGLLFVRDYTIVKDYLSRLTRCFPFVADGHAHGVAGHGGGVRVDGAIHEQFG